MHHATQNQHLAMFLAIDLSSAVDEWGWMDSHDALMLFPARVTGGVEVNIGSARAGYVFDTIAELLSAARAVRVVGTDSQGVAAFQTALHARAVA